MLDPNAGVAVVAGTVAVGLRPAACHSSADSPAICARRHKGTGAGVAWVRKHERIKVVHGPRPAALCRKHGVGAGARHARSGAHKRKKEARLMFATHARGRSHGPGAPITPLTSALDDAVKQGTQPTIPLPPSLPRAPLHAARACCFDACARKV